MAGFEVYLNGRFWVSPEAFLISAQRQAGATSRVEITSERGGTCVLVSPFTGKELKLAMKPGQRIVLTSDPAE